MRCPQRWLYRRIWSEVVERLDTLPAEEQEAVVRLLLRHARALAQIPNLASMVASTLRELAGRKDAGMLRPSE